MKLGKTLAYAFAGLTVAAFLRQRYRPIPLPPWLSFLLENPVTEHFTGADLLIERFGLMPGMCVLDAGCGPGRLTIPLAKAVGEKGQIVALDSQRDMLDRLEQKVISENLSNVRLVEASLGERALERNVFDRVILMMVLGEVRDRASALREIRDSLKPGGVLSVTEAVGDPDYHRPATVRREAEDAGLRLTARYGGFPAYTLNFEKSLTAEQATPKAFLFRGALHGRLVFEE